MNEWEAYFGKQGIPSDLLQLLTFAFDNDYIAESDLADGFLLYVDSNKTGLKTYSDHPEFLNAFYEFAQADGTGATYAIWHYDKSKPLNEMPIVAFGSEGGEYIVAKNLRELLQILTYDIEPMILDDGVTYFKDEDREDEYPYQPSTYHDEFVEWLKETFDLAPLENEEQVNKIVTNAQAEFGEKFKHWFEQYFEDE